MKNLLTLAMTVLAFNAGAQVTLERQYQNHPDFDLVNIENEIQTYVGVEQFSASVKFYGLNHSLQKTISLQPLTQHNSDIKVQFVSKYLFDQDSDMEFLVRWTHTVAGFTTHYMAIYEESGQPSLQIGYGKAAKLVNTSAGWRMIVDVDGGSYGYTEVYKLPGQWTGMAPEGTNGTDEVSSAIFPNPVQSVATIRYSLPAGTTAAAIQVYNVNGVKVQEYKVTNQFQDVLISRGELPAGTYFYNVTAPGLNQPGEKFIIL